MMKKKCGMVLCSVTLLFLLIVSRVLIERDLRPGVIPRDFATTIKAYVPLQVGLENCRIT